MKEWLPVLIQGAMALFSMGVFWGLFISLRAQFKTHTENNREDHTKIFNKLEDHGERLATVETVCGIPSPPNGKSRGMHA